MNQVYCRVQICFYIWRLILYSLPSKLMQLEASLQLTAFLDSDSCGKLAVRIETPILFTLDFSLSTFMIILNSDVSTLFDGDTILFQHQSDGRIRPERFESSVWSQAKLKYDSVNLNAGDCSRRWRNFNSGYMNISSSSILMHKRLYGILINFQVICRMQWCRDVSRIFDYSTSMWNTFLAKTNCGADALSQRNQD